MQPRRNPEAIAKVMAADARGESSAQMKPLYIEQNTFDIALDAPIYRIAQTRHLLDDIKSGRLTHTCVGPMIWGDPAENPLLAHTYVDPATGCELSLHTLATDLFGVCWSLSPTATPQMWSYFSYGQDAVRIQSTPRKLLDAVMDLRNPFFMLQHFVGRMKYEPEDAFDTYFKDQDFLKHLDSLGQGLALSTMRLPDGPSQEQEIRLVFQVNRELTWSTEHVEFRPDFASPPFRWNNVIERVVVGPQRAPAACTPLATELDDLGVTCAVVSAIDSTSTSN